MRLAPGRDSAGSRERRRENSTKGDFPLSPLAKPLNVGSRCGTSFPVEIAHLPEFRIVDQPECVPSKAAHTRINYGQRRAGGNCRIYRWTTRTEDIHSRLGSESMRAGNHPVRSQRYGASGLQFHVFYPSMNKKYRLPSIIQICCNAKEKPV